MLIGAVFGAAVMYLLDPQSGRNRRHFLADTARQGVRGAGQALAGRTRQAMDYASDELSHHASLAANEVRDTIPQTWRSRASHWLAPEHHYIAPAAGITAGGIALIAMGAGLAFFFDPYRGRTRRHVAGEFVRRTGQRISNRGPVEHFESQNVSSDMDMEPGMMHREPEPNEI